MNPLGNNSQTNQLSSQLMQNIKQVKDMMQIMRGNPIALAQQNPMFNQVLQLCKGQNPQQMFLAMCKKQGIDPEAILNELRN